MRHAHGALHGILVRVVATSLFSAWPLAAQTGTRGDSSATPRVIVGRVLDEIARGLPGADVRTAAGLSAVTDSAGRFVLRGPPSGALRLVARKVGYDSASANVPPESMGAASEVTLVLTRTHRLNEIVVEGKVYDRALWDRGFYHRQKVASGTGPVKGMGGGAAEGVGLKELIGFREIAAVEVYPRASSVPIQFQRMGPPAGPQGMTSQQIGSPGGRSGGSSSQGENQDSACGAIVIWTKSPADEDPAAPASAVHRPVDRVTPLHAGPRSTSRLARGLPSSPAR